MREADKLKISGNPIFEGMTSIRAVFAALEQGKSNRKILRLMVSASRKSARYKELSYLTAMSYKYGFDIEVLDDGEIEKIALGSSHGGLLLETTERIVPKLSAEAISKYGETKKFFVMLEGIEDPYNFGYAIRSLYAAGADAIILSPRNWLGAAGIVCRASAGASELCDVYICESPLECAEIMRENKIKIVCCDMENSSSIYDADLKYPLFLAVGGEKRGISTELLSMADMIVRLDYGRDFKNALSAASAASIAGFEILRQNR